LLAATPAVGQDTQESDSSESANDEGMENAIVVTGRRAALEAADERKRNSETIIDSVVADEAGKLPDNSITEVLQRVQGVTIVKFRAINDPDHFSVEGSGVQVRGLSGVASRLNGREIFSANNGRALLWGDVTPELMAAVDVYKASTADLIEGGTGGQIDLRTKLPFDYSGGLHVAATGDVSTGDLAEKTDYSGSILLTDRWSTGIGDIGVLVDLAYSKLSSNSHFFRMETYYRTNISGSDYFIPGGYTYGEEQFQRKRDGIYAALQWAPSDALTFTGTFFQSRYKNKSGDWGPESPSLGIASVV
jgi:TonB-dependent receptor